MYTTTIYPTLYLLLTLVWAVSPIFSQNTSSSTAYEYPFLNPSIDMDDRISDLVSRLTVEEKIAQLRYDSPAIDKLGIPAYNWWNEALHGVARAGRATIFPQAIGMAATFDEDLIHRIATAISDEARAKFNANVANNNRIRYAGLTFWTPNVNIFRDPRWGRGQETYGEDPYLSGLLGSAFVRGLQGDHPDYLKAAACAKHYVVHSGPEKDRHVFDAVVSKKDLYETYLPAFKSLVEAEVEAVMCAYNRTNGEPCCGSPYLLQDILRQELGFDGHILSDCWALQDFHDGHNVTDNPIESAALALKSGVNLNCGDTYPYLKEALEQGLVTEAMIDSSLAILLRTRFRLGMFDPAEMDPFSDIGPEVINSAAHQQLAREAAQNSIVMLKNDNALPLDTTIKHLFVTGPNATNTEVLMANYYGVSGNMYTILEGVTEAVSSGSVVRYKHGFLLDRPNVNPIDWTTGDAQQADAIIVAMGISGLLEGEEGESIASPTKGDRFDMNIPQNQIDFLKKLRSGYDNPVITVITGGSPMDLREVHELSDAVLFAWYPGEQGGRAVADILFGKVSPSGRLPITFPKSVEQLPDYADYDMEGRTYRYMTAEPMYPFGYGLSYSSFSYNNLTLSQEEFSEGDKLTVSVEVSNKGEIAAREVAQLYINSEIAEFATPLYALRSVQALELKPGETQTINFTLDESMLIQVNEKGDKVLSPGTYQVHVGGTSPVPVNEKLGLVLPLKQTFTIK